MKLALTHQTNFEFKAADKAYAKAFSLQAALDETIREKSHPPAPHPLRFVSEEPHTIDPTLCGDVASGRIVEQIFSGLVTHSPKGNVLPDAASRWKVLEGGKHYVFHLREDSFWSDGVPVTAGDFEFAIKRALDPKMASPLAVMQYDIKNARPYHTGKLSDPDLIGIYTKDDHTLEFELENPAAYFLQLLGTHAFYPVPRHAVENYGDEWAEPENIVSNGAFLLDSWVLGESLVLKKNPRYHGQFEGNLLCVEVTFTNQVENALQAYLEDGFDFLIGGPLTMDQQAYARQYLSDEYFYLPQLGILYVSFDTRSRPFSDPHVRRAFALAADREALVGKVFQGFVSPANGGLLPPGMPGHVSNVALPYDPHRARLLMAEAGYPAGKGFPVLEGFWVGSPIVGARGEAAQILEEMWLENLGIHVNWSQVNWKEMMRLSLERGKKPSLLIGGWGADYPDPHNFFVDAQWNRFADQENLWDHQEYNRLIQKAKGVLNQEERINLYTQADRIIVEEAPLIPIWYGSTQGLQKPWVKGLAFREAQSAYFKEVIIEEH
jgi:oligopeptide transport system substrate-binding protein